MFYDLAQLHHVGFVVDDLEASAAALGNLYGLDIALFPEAQYPCLIDGARYDTVQRMGLSAGPPFVELIRTVPDSPVWQPRAGIHHLGGSWSTIWSPPQRIWPGAARRCG